MTRPDTSPPPADPAAEEEAPTGVVRVSGVLPLSRIFTPEEAALVREVQRFAHEDAGDYSRDLQGALERGLRSLGTMVLSLESYPSLRDRHVLGQRERTQESLMRSLIEGGEHGLEWVLPTKALLSRTYGIAKVHFFTGLRYVVDACQGQRARDLHVRLEGATEEAVYTRLAEELYASFITSRTTDRNVKTLAAQHLIRMWEGRLSLATRRLCPLLRSAWAARMRAPRVFGTLMGATEIVQLLFQDCDEKFVTYFAQQRPDSEQVQAFEEFLFDLPYESLERVRARMREEGKSCVGPREVEVYLGFGEGRLRPLAGDPKGLYVSFRRRRVKAQYRTSMGVPGPKRTAEGYMLEALLLSEQESESPAPARPD
jgi:hypothetical protein